jgi:glucokinase
MVIIGTGVGGAFLVDGHLGVGANTIAGMPGMYLPGMETSIEAIASGQAIARTLGVENGHLGLDLARQGDSGALRAFADAADALDWVVATATSITDSDRVVIGGGFGLAAYDLLFPTGKISTKRRFYPAIHDRITILPASTAERAGQLGLAARIFCEAGLLSV